MMGCWLALFYGDPSVSMFSSSLDVFSIINEGQISGFIGMGWGSSYKCSASSIISVQSVFTTICSKPRLSTWSSSCYGSIVFLELWFTGGSTTIDTWPASPTIYSRYRLSKLVTLYGDDELFTPRFSFKKGRFEWISLMRSWWVFLVIIFLARLYLRVASPMRL